MQVTTTHAPNSSVVLEIELPPERLNQAVDAAVRRLSRRTRVPGFRPGKAPRPMLERTLGPGVVLDEAVEHLVDDAYRQALVEQSILPLTNADVEIVQAEEGKPVIFKATVQVRPDVELGDYKNFNFTPEIDVIDDARVDQVIDELRDQHATLAAVEDRGAKDGDYTVIAFQGTRDGEPFEGGSSDRMPLIIGQERLIPGFEGHLVGLEPGGETEFDVTFPDDYPEESLQGAQAHFAVQLKELREKIQPPLDDDFASQLGDFDNLSELRADIRHRLERNTLDRARHQFADRIIEYAIANATVELPEVLVDQEVEVMHDEFRTSIARQGITEEAYLKVVEKTEADLHADFRPNAEKRVKTLLVLSKIADQEGVEVPEDAIEVEIAQGRERYADDRRLLGYFDSERGRSFIRSTLRRSRLVEQLVDEWLAAHPDHPPLPHVEEPEPAVADEAVAAEAASSTEAAEAAETAEAAEAAETTDTTPSEPATAG